MAHKIVVISSSGQPTGEQLKKSVATLLVRRLLAHWIVENRSIVRVPIREFKSALPHRIVRYKPYIPEALPPAEVGGCVFEEPNGSNWRVTHRACMQIAVGLCK